MKSTEKRIMWLSYLVLDLSLHRTTQLEIIKNLAKRGYHTTLFAMRSRTKFRVHDNQGDRLVNPPAFFLVPLRSLSIISTAMYAFVITFIVPVNIFIFNIDFVVVPAGVLAISSIPSIIFSKFRKTKFILDTRSVPVDVQGFYGSIHKFWFNVSFLVAKKLFSGITIITPTMKQEICAKFSINPTRVGVWTSGVSTQLFDPDLYRIKSNELKAKLGLSGKFIVFYHGNLSATRGITEAITTMKIIADQYPEAVLFLLGSGPFASQLKSSIKRENIQNNVIIHNAVDYEQVPNYISMSDVCIIPLPDYPYWRSQSPLKLLEYLAMEKTVIATDLPSHRSVLGKEKCGIYLSSVDPEVIAKAIDFAILNKEKLGAWGKTGREIVLRDFTWEKVSKDFQNYLESLK